jgi:hypothetical protein
MGQGPLVIEQIEAGTEFIYRLNAYVLVSVAFWLKASDEGRWNLYIASDKINDSTKKAAYGEVARVTREMDNPNLDQFQVTLIGSDDPLARAASDVHRRFAARVPTRVRDKSFGGMSVEEVYIYPPLPYGADAEKWRGISVGWWPDSSGDGAYWVEFRYEPLVMTPWPAGPKRMLRPAQVLVKGGKVIEYRPPEKALPHLTQSDYEKKALEVVEQMAVKSA